MPTYEYACTSCDHHVEVVQGFAEDPLETCPRCGGRLRRVYHPAGILFKGAGFYSTDNRGGKGSGKPDQEKATPAAKGPAEKPAAAAKPSEKSA